MNLLTNIGLAVLVIGIPVAVWLAFSWFNELRFYQDTGVLPKT